jgi:hypothetical protein
MLKDFNDDILLSLHSLHSRNIEPVASQQARELTKYNWFGHTLLHQREGNELKLLVQSKMLALKMGMREIEETQETLRKEKEEMEATVKLYMKMQEELKVAQVSMQKVKQEVEEAKQHPVVNKAMQFHAQTIERHSSSTPFSLEPRKQRTPSAEASRDSSERAPIYIRPSLFDDDDSSDSSEDEIGKGSEGDIPGDNAKERDIAADNAKERDLKDTMVADVEQG